MKKIRSIIIGICMLVLLFATGCNNLFQSGEKSDITYLYVGTYGGGFGVEWLEKLEKSFEEKYKDYSFEEGKKGVDVVITANQATMSGTSLISSMKSDLRETVFFTIDAIYHDFLKENLLYDMTDVVTKSLTEYGEDKSIENKMSEEAKNYFKVKDKYYALPFCDTPFGIIYNVDLFQGKGFYFKENGGWTGDITQATAGPNGKKGIDSETGMDYSSDDGLPSTFEEFYELCNKINKDNCLPFVWSGKQLNYFSHMLINVTADVEGANQFKLNLTQNGTANSLVGDTNNIDITDANGYELSRQQGKLSALEFAKTIANNASTWCHKNAFLPSFLNSGAQEYFLAPKFDSSLGKEAAMLVEGIFWENEAKSIFSELAEIYGPKAMAKNRKFAFMPMPKVSKDVKTNRTICATGNSACFMNGKIAKNKIKVSEMFVKFAHSDENLIGFTETTGLPRQFNYKLSEEQLNNLTYFSRDLWKIYQTETVISDYRTSELIHRNASEFTISTFWKAGALGNEPISYFKNNPNKSASYYLNKMYEYNKNNWASLK